MFNRKSSITASLLALGALCAGTAQAADVHWSVGINLPHVGTVISNAPAYYPPAPVYVEPAPVVVYRPAPRPVVVYQPVPQVVYRPVPVYAPRHYSPGVVRAGWAVPVHGGKHDGHRGHGHGKHDRHDHRGDRHDDHRGDHRGDRRQHH
jgi:hypothetical protein